MKCQTSECLSPDVWHRPVETCGKKSRPPKSVEKSPVPVRYARQAALPEFGERGQARLAAGRVLIVGVGRTGIAGGDVSRGGRRRHAGARRFRCAWTRRISTARLSTARRTSGGPKLAAAAERLRAINPHVTLELHEEPFGAGNARRLVERYDVVIDGTDNFPTRYLVNDACVMTKTPNVYGSILGSKDRRRCSRQVAGPAIAACIRSRRLPGLISNCAEAGVLGVLPGIIGTIQATEAIKLLTGIGEPLVGRLLLYDALRMRLRQITLPRDPECPVCGDHPTIHELVAYDQRLWLRSSSDRSDLSVDELRRVARLRTGPHARSTCANPSEHAQSRIEGAMLIPLGTLEEPARRDPEGSARRRALPVRGPERAGRRELLRRHGLRRPQPAGRDPGLASSRLHQPGRTGWECRPVFKLTCK